MHSTNQLPIKQYLQLTEKGYVGANCLAYAHIGNNKITLTIKPKKRTEQEILDEILNDDLIEIKTLNEINYE